MEVDWSDGGGGAKFPALEYFKLNLALKAVAP